MEPIAQPLIVAVDRMDRGVIIYFDDGSKGLFSDVLLYSVLSEATPIVDAESQD